MSVFVMVISVLNRKLNDDEKIVEAVIGYFNCFYHLLFSAESWFYRPPSDTQEKLEELADSTGKIIDQFNVSIEYSPWSQNVSFTSLSLLESPSDGIPRPDPVYKSDRWL